MPTPYPNIFTGINEGLRMGMLYKQQAQAEQEQSRKIAAEEQKAKKDSVFKGLETGESLMKIKHPAIRQQGLDITMKTIRDNADFFGIDPKSIPETIQWSDNFEPVVKEIDEGMKAYKEGRIDDATALGALNASLMRAKQIMESEDVESLRKGKEAEIQTIRGEKERGMLQQAAMIPGLAQKGVLTPEQAGEGRLTALAGGGAEGEKLLAEGLKPDDKKDDYVETTVGGVPVKLPTSVYVTHVDREAQREQSRINHEENLALRKQLADMMTGMRNRLPASKVQELSTKETKLDKYASLINEFEDSFGGSMVGGPTMTSVYSKAPAALTSEETKRRVKFWKEFNALDSEIRHDLFGATLTGNEVKSWDSQTVNENADPAIIRERLKYRRDTATNAYQREVSGYEQAGYSTGKQGGTPAPQRRATDKGGVRRYNPTTGRIE